MDSFVCEFKIGMDFYMYMKNMDESICIGGTQGWAPPPKWKNRDEFPYGHNKYGQILLYGSTMIPATSEPSAWAGEAASAAGKEKEEQRYLLARAHWVGGRVSSLTLGVLGPHQTPCPGPRGEVECLPTGGTTQSEARRMTELRRRV